MIKKEITDERMLNKAFLLKEIEAYLSFRLLEEEPTIPVEDMRIMANDIRISLKHSNIEYWKKKMKTVKDKKIEILRRLIEINKQLNSLTRYY